MRTQHSRERGVALATALVLLTVVALISIYAASSGALGLHMAKNMQDAFDSFQKAEAGVAAVVSLGGKGQVPSLLQVETALAQVLSAPRPVPQSPAWP